MRPAFLLIIANEQAVLWTKVFCTCLFLVQWETTLEGPSPRKRRLQRQSSSLCRLSMSERTLTCYNPCNDSSRQHRCLQYRWPQVATLVAAAVAGTTLVRTASLAVLLTRWGFEFDFWNPKPCKPPGWHIRACPYYQPWQLQLPPRESKMRCNCIPLQHCIPLQRRCIPRTPWQAFGIK